MPRHRHAEGYVAVVLAGGYLEAGDCGRVYVQAGQAVIHAAHESHQDEFSLAGATVLNLPLVEGIGAATARVDDADAVARLAEHHPLAAARLLRDTLQPLGGGLDDWPDRLAAALARDPELQIAEWAAQERLAPQSVSRGFRRVYGTSPKRYRIEQRTLRAVRALGDWPSSLAGLAAELGFADQAHLTRAVRAITGLSPRRLRVKSVQEGWAARR
jgi:AraC-like DNA-binding protein